MQQRSIKVLASKIGLDEHDRGSKVMAPFVREAGMEVIYLGRFQTAQGIVRSALQEDVDIIGVSCLSNEHLTLVPVLMEEVKESRAEHIPVVLGGTIPTKDIPQLKELGVVEVFSSGTPMNRIVDYIHSSTEKGSRKAKLYASNG